MLLIVLIFVDFDQNTYFHFTQLVRMGCFLESKKKTQSVDLKGFYDSYSSIKCSLTIYILQLILVVMNKLFCFSDIENFCSAARCSENCINFISHD